LATDTQGQQQPAQSGPRPRRYGPSSGDGPGDRRRPYGAGPSRRVCAFCKDKNLRIDYKRHDMLQRYITDRGKIQPRRGTGLCARHQRGIALAIKRARHLALLPYATTHPRRG
jgi:small subunit ribosomal protein S18